jgi:hypothetical protein
VGAFAAYLVTILGRAQGIPRRPRERPRPGVGRGVAFVAWLLVKAVRVHEQDEGGRVAVTV